MKDWKGNGNSIYRTIGASNHCDQEREAHDYYATEPDNVEKLLDLISFEGTILEPRCGEGHISKVLESHGYDVVSGDLIDRGYGQQWDFLNGFVCPEGVRNIVTNPPYSFAHLFVEKSLDIVPDGGKVVMFLKLTFLEGKARKKLFLANPPKVVYVSSSRMRCGKNGVFEGGSAVAYAWFVWEKGYKGDTIIKWFN